MLDYSRLQETLDGPFYTIYNRVEIIRNNSPIRVNVLPFFPDSVISTSNHGLAFSSSQDDKNIYHFVLHALPKLAVLSSFEGARYPLIFGYKPSQLQEDVLSCVDLNICAIVLEGSPLTQLEGKRAYKFKELLFVDVEKISLKERSRIIRQLFAHKLRKLEGNTPKKIYITRKDATNNPRILRNQTHVETLLSANGYVPLQMSEFEFIYQAAIFQNATHIVFEHGAAGVFLIFCNRSCKVIELLPARNCPTSDGICNTYLELSRANDLNYASIIGHEIEIDRNRDIHWKIDLNILASALVA
jgi:capsular polysaccharide biosynthesis protein